MPWSVTLRRLTLAAAALALVPLSLSAQQIAVAPPEMTGVGEDAPELDDPVVDRSRLFGFFGLSVVSGVKRPLSSRLGLVTQQEVWAGVGVFASAQTRMILAGSVLQNEWIAEVGLRRAVRTNIDAIVASGWTAGNHWIGVGANVFNAKDPEAWHDVRVGFDLRVGYYPGLRGMMFSGGVVMGHPFGI